MSNIIFAQAAVYNCNGATDSSYGASSFGTCTNSTNQTGSTATTNTVGAPNTGFLQAITTGSGFAFTGVILAIVIIAALCFKTVTRRLKNRT